MSDDAGGEDGGRPDGRPTWFDAADGGEGPDDENEFAPDGADWFDDAEPRDEDVAAADADPAPSADDGAETDPVAAAGTATPDETRPPSGSPASEEDDETGDGSAAEGPHAVDGDVGRRAARGTSERREASAGRGGESGTRPGETTPGDAATGSGASDEAGPMPTSDSSTVGTGSTGDRESGTRTVDPTGADFGSSVPEGQTDTDGPATNTSPWRRFVGWLRALFPGGSD